MIIINKNNKKDNIIEDSGFQSGNIIKIEWLAFPINVSRDD